MTISHPPTLRKPTEGRTIAVVGDLYRFLATGDETNGKYAMFEAIVPPGGGPPPHTHSREEESFLILEGEITFMVNGEKIVATAGTFANMPVGSLHSFKRGAFLFGEGVHGYVKPDGHFMDDLWFYDIHAHAWTCLYPGMNTKTFTQRVKDKQLLLDENGQLIDNDKQPIPLHTLVHAWGYLTYDSDRSKFAFIGWNGMGNKIPRYYLGNENAYFCHVAGDSSDNGVMWVYRYKK